MIYQKLKFTLGTLTERELFSRNTWKIFSYNENLYTVNCDFPGSYGYNIAISR